MAVLRRVAVVLSLALLAPHQAAAEGNCTTIDVDFVPAARQGNPFGLQMVAWIETPSSQFRGTAFITQQTGSFGIGNRPGRFDFNTGPAWPYGRRITTFPVWAHRHGLSWNEVVFQNDLDSDLSHPFNESSREGHFCRPLQPDEEAFDAMTCPSAVFTDKGVFDLAKTSLYPPRNDLIRATPDNPDVDMFGTMNPFDSVSQATPPSGTPATLSYAVPEDLAFGDYVMFVEVSRELDQNASYSFPGPTGISFEDYGVPYRGQPSVVYRIPFSITDATETTATTADYFGYGDPDGIDGTVREPDNTITVDVPGSGAQRLQLVSENGNQFRVRVTSKPQIDLEPPAVPGDAQVTEATSNSATIAFVAPGDDGLTGRVTKYEIRYVVGEPMTAERFATAAPVDAGVVPGSAGAIQSFVMEGLLPETEYSIGIRAIDDCRNVGALTVLAFTTPERDVGSVDACFIATAAYGSVMANDVDMLRRFRDAMLRKSVLGELAVESYYTFGPAVSNVVGESDLLRHTARDLLEPIVTRVRGLQITPK